MYADTTMHAVALVLNMALIPQVPLERDGAIGPIPTSSTGVDNAGRASSTGITMLSGDGGPIISYVQTRSFVVCVLAFSCVYISFHMSSQIVASI